MREHGPGHSEHQDALERIAEDNRDINKPKVRYPIGRLKAPILGGVMGLGLITFAIATHPRFDDSSDYNQERRWDSLVSDAGKISTEHMSDELRMQIAGEYALMQADEGLQNDINRGKLNWVVGEIGVVISTVSIVAAAIDKSHYKWTKRKELEDEKIAGEINKRRKEEGRAKGARII